VASSSNTLFIGAPSGDGPASAHGCGQGPFQASGSLGVARLLLFHPRLFLRFQHRLGGAKFLAAFVSELLQANDAAFLVDAQAAVADRVAPEPTDLAVAVAVH